MKISYNWLKSHIPDIPKAKEVENLLIFHLCEVESTEELSNGDTIFDLKILPDRAHDLLSHYGVAFEIAGLLGLEIKENSFGNSFQEVLARLPNSDGQGRGRRESGPDHLGKNSTSEFSKTSLQIEIESPNCRRYMGRIIRGIKVGPSPEWMKVLLESIGQRSINNIVDATNFVMFDCGQPIHAFDLGELSEEKIIVRQAKDGDEIDLVGSEKIKANLKNTDMMISDGAKNLAIAGVKGGLHSGIKDETKDILIEVANFEPVSVRKTARRLGLQTDASKRYENDLSQELCSVAMEEISKILMEMFPDALFEEVVDIYPNKQEKKIVSFKSQYISKSLGLNVKDQEIEKILKNYKYVFSQKPDLWEVEIPYMRLDLNGPHDFVEELGRVYGYEKIKAEIPKIKNIDKDNEIWVKICLAKQKLVEDGYKEIMTYIFKDKGEVEILASASDKNFLRANLTDGLEESLNLNQNNLPLLDIDEVKIFEIGMVFTNKGEQMNVAYGNKKDITEMTLNKYIEKNLPEFSSDMFDKIKKEEEQGRELNYLQKNIDIFRPWSIYPFITRDIAVWVPEGVRPEELVNIYKSFGTELLIKEPKLFDSFTKPAKEDEKAKTSFAYRLVFQSYDRTLTDEEINQIMSKIAEKISSLGWEVR